MFYPVMLNIEEKLISVVGGGEVALRKVKTLLGYKAVVRVISPEFSEGFKHFENKIELIKDYYKEELIKDSFIVIAATSSKQVNLSISHYCRQNNILCSMADDAKESDFIVPSSLRRGSLVIAVSTEGKSPALSSKIKKEIEEKYSEEYELYVEVLGDIRHLLLEKCSDAALRKKLLKEVLNLSLEELIKRRDELEVCSRF